jgi:GNAT superfamily N-acetyltransferase
VRSWEAAYRGLLPDEAFTARDFEARVELWRGHLERLPERHEVVVADDEGTIIGFAAYGPSEDAAEAAASVGELRALYVRPERWGEGTGVALLEASERRLRELGFSESRLRVLAGNWRARRFYEGADWSEAGPDEEYAGAATVCYRKRLVA